MRNLARRFVAGDMARRGYTRDLTEAEAIIFSNSDVPIALGGPAHIWKW
jgi:hypothetical protein